MDSTAVKELDGVARDAVSQEPIAPASAVKTIIPAGMLRFMVGSAVAAGIAADLLLRTFPWGINVTILVALLCSLVAWAWIAHAKETPCWPLLCAILIFGGCVAWRDSPVLRALNLAAIAALLVVLCARPRGIDLGATTLSSLFLNAASAAGQVLGSPLRLQGDIDWAAASRWQRGPTSRRVLRALLITIPLVLAFAWLFASADAVFKHVVTTSWNWLTDSLFQGRELAGHALWSLILSVCAYAVLRPLVLGDKWRPVSPNPRSGMGIGVLETAFILGGLLLVFGLFIAIQFRYLFGGDRLVQAIPGLTYAQYARSGFFALLGVVLLLHILLLAGSWLIAHADPATQRLFRGLSLCLILLTGFVFVSAFWRLSLYVDAYGLTQSRFYAAAVLTWLALVFILFTAKVLRPAWSFFGGTYVFSFLAVLLLLNVLNPDAAIAGINLDRAQQGKELDMQYLDSLSADAAPTLVTRDGLSPDVHSSLVAIVIMHNSSYGADTWQAWNYGRWRSHQAVVGP